MKIAIIGAMNEEITPLLELFGQEFKKHHLGGNTFYEIAYKNAQIFIAYSKIGKVHAAITASTMILHFGCQKVLFSGVAGALSEDLEVGDLLLASKLCQHDVDISAFGHPLGFIPESSLYVETDSVLNDLARQIAKKKGIALKEGIIASGDQFIHNMDKKHAIVQNFDAMCVEMEGASVGVVCHNFGVPFCIFRSISDKADGSADVNFDEFLESSAKVSAEFVRDMIDAMI